MDPVLFTINIGNFSLTVNWYGVILMTATLIAAWLTARELERTGKDPDLLWDVLPILVITGVIGARLWYVTNDILGGNVRYLENPATILYTWEGGLHIFGAFLFGGIAFIIYARKKQLNVWTLLDAVAPYLLIGQALARPANFINQELYGPPTNLPWGISIGANHRIPPWNDLVQFPLETTRFHPTFAYEMLWNFLAGGLIIWISRKYEEKLRPGTLFFCWMILAGVGRVIIETFRPDQPVIPGTGLSYSRLVSLLLALIGGILILARFEKINLPFWKTSPAEETLESEEAQA